MLYNYLITAFRNFLRNKSYTFLNVIGLGLGLSGTLVIFSIVTHQTSFDHFHSKADRVYRLVDHYSADYGMEYDPSLPYPLGEALKNDIPDFEAVAQFHGPDGGVFSFHEEGVLRNFKEEQILYAEPEMFKMLDFKILQGEGPDGLGDLNKIYLTEFLADKYFGNHNPIGRTINLNKDRKLTVAGIIENHRNNTNIPYRAIVSLVTHREMYPGVYKDNWGMNWACAVYVMLPENADRTGIERKLDEVAAKYLDEDDRAKTNYELQPLKEIHTDERYGDFNHYIAPSVLIYALLVIGVLLLGASCLNFVNLATAQAFQRSREVGVRKTLGGSKSDLIFQFLLETLIIVFVAGALSITLAQYFLIQVNEWLTLISVDFGLGWDAYVFLAIMVIAVTLLAGFYPAFVISGFQPSQALKGKIGINKGSGSMSLRRVMVIFQLVFTNLILISTVIVAAQIYYLKTKPLGFDPEHVIQIQGPSGSWEKLPAVKSSLMQKPFVTKISQAWSSPQADSNWGSEYTLPGEAYRDGYDANLKFIDDDYFETFGLKLLSGQMLPQRMVKDSLPRPILVNETLLRSLELDPANALGAHVDYNGNMKGQVYGVVKDFHVYSLQNELAPIIFEYRAFMMDKLYIRVSTSDWSTAITDIESIFREYFPNDLFDYNMVTAEVDENYLEETLLFRLIFVFCGLSIALSILGLYGLVSFMSQKNAKSIGIRKVFGASTGNILKMVSKEYIYLTVFGFLLAFPLGYLAMDSWVSEFTYGIEIGPEYFLVSFVLSLLISTLSVGYKSAKAASSNPIDSLRYE